MSENTQGQNQQNNVRNIMKKSSMKQNSKYGYGSSNGNNNINSDSQAIPANNLSLENNALAQSVNLEQQQNKKKSSLKILKTPQKQIQEEQIQIRKSLLSIANSLNGSQSQKGDNFDDLESFGSKYSQGQNNQRGSLGKPSPRQTIQSQNVKSMKLQQLNQQQQEKRRKAKEEHIKTQQQLRRNQNPYEYRMNILQDIALKNQIRINNPPEVQRLKWLYHNYIKRFYIILFNSIPSQVFKRFQQIEQTEYIVIDKGSSYVQKENISKEYILEQNLEIKLQKIPVLKPGNLIITVFDIIIFIYYLLQIWSTPIRIAYYNDKQMGYNLFNEHLGFGISIILVNIVLSLNTSFYQEGFLITSRYVIIKSYLKQQFLVDLGCLISHAVQYNWFSVIFMFQLNKLEMIFYNMDMQFQFSEKYQNSVNLVKLVFLIMSVAHLSACGFLFLENIEIDPQNSWLISKELADKVWHIKYLYSVYFMFITMSTIGYGDISPQTNIEMIYGMVMTLLACGVFAYAVNMIGTMFQEKAIKEREYKQHRVNALKFMQTRNISKQSQIKVLKYLEYQFMYQNQEGNMQKGQEVLDSISKNIRDEVYSEFYPQVLSQSILKQYFTTNFIDKISLFMKERTLSEGEVIYHEGGINKNLYFLIKGGMEVYEQDQKNRNIIKDRIFKGEFFGYKGFLLPGYQQEENIRSNGISQVLYLQREDFQNLIVDYPKDFEKYIELVEEILNKPFNLRKCNMCNQFSHSTLICPLVHYIPDYQKIKIRYNQILKKPQDRQRYFRSTIQLKYKAYKDILDYREHIIQFKKTLIFQFNDYEEFHEIIQQMNEQEEDEDIINQLPYIYFSEKGQLRIQTIKQYCEDLNKLIIQDPDQIKSESQIDDLENSDNSQIQKSGFNSENPSLQNINLNKEKIGQYTQKLIPSQEIREDTHSSATSINRSRKRIQTEPPISQNNNYNTLTNAIWQINDANNSQNFDNISNQDENNRFNINDNDIFNNLKNANRLLTDPNNISNQSINLNTSANNLKQTLNREMTSNSQSDTNSKMDVTPRKKQKKMSQFSKKLSGILQEQEMKNQQPSNSLLNINTSQNNINNNTLNPQQLNNNNSNNNIIQTSISNNNKKGGFKKRDLFKKQTFQENQNNINGQNSILQLGSIQNIMGEDSVVKNISQNMVALLTKQQQISKRMSINTNMFGQSQVQKKKEDVPQNPQFAEIIQQLNDLKKIIIVDDKKKKYNCVGQGSNLNVNLDFPNSAKKEQEQQKNNIDNDNNENLNLFDINQEEEIYKEQFMIDEFDFLQQFKYFRPWNNIQNVLQQQIQFSKKNIKKRKEEENIRFQQQEEKKMKLMKQQSSIIQNNKEVVNQLGKRTSIIINNIPQNQGENINNRISNILARSVVGTNHKNTLGQRRSILQTSKYGIDDNNGQDISQVNNSMAAFKSNKSCCFTEYSSRSHESSDDSQSISERLKGINLSDDNNKEKNKNTQENNEKNNFKEDQQNYKKNNNNKNKQKKLGDEKFQGRNEVKKLSFQVQIIEKDEQKQQNINSKSTQEKIINFESQEDNINNNSQKSEILNTPDKNQENQKIFNNNDNENQEDLNKTSLITGLENDENKEKLIQQIIEKENQNSKDSNLLLASQKSNQL